MKNKKYILAILTLAFAFKSLTASPTCGHDHGAAPSVEETAMSLRVQASKSVYESLKLKDAKVQKLIISKNVQALGQIENIPEYTYDVSSRIDGKVAELYVSLGDRVKKGQKIAKVESLLAGDPPPSVTLIATSDGVVESLQMTNGSPIQANTPLARIVDAKKIYAVANVFEDDFALLEIGQDASVKLMGDKLYEAKLKKFSPVANANKIAVYFEIDNTSLELRQNMRASFNIEVSKEEESLCVPNSALGGQFPRHFVFVQECAEDLIYEKIEVVVGSKDENFTQILSGLKEGDIVACNNIYHLQFLPSASGTHSHSHTAGTSCDDFVPTAVTHSHSHEEHTFWEECLECFGAVKDYVVALPESVYFNAVVYMGLAISLLLNICFIGLEFFPRKRGAKE